MLVSILRLGSLLDDFEVGLPPCPPKQESQGNDKYCCERVVNRRNLVLRPCGLNMNFPYSKISSFIMVYE